MRKEDIKNFHGPGNASIRIKGLMLICRFPRVLLRPEKKESGVLQTYVLRIATISDFLDFFFYLRITYCYDFRFLCLSLSLTYYVLLVLLRFPISLPFSSTYVITRFPTQIRAASTYKVMGLEGFRPRSFSAILIF